MIIRITKMIKSEITPRFFVLTTLIISIVFILGIVQTTEASVFDFDDAADGNWNIGATWGNGGNNVEGSGYPGSNDTVMIDSHTVTLTAEQSSDAIAMDGGTLTAGAQTLNISGDFTYIYGTFNYDTGTVVFSGNIQTLTGGGISLYNMEVDTGSKLIIVGTTTVTNDLTLTDGNLDNGASGVLNVEGDITLGSVFGAAHDDNDGLIILTGSSSSITYAAGGILPKVTVNKTNATDVVTISGTGPIDFYEDFTITQGIFDISGLDLTLRSTSTFSNDGTLRLQGDETVTFNQAAGFDEDSGEVEFDGTSTYTQLPNGFGDSFYNLTLNGSGIWQLDATSDVANNLTITAGTLDFNGQNITTTTNLDVTGTLKLTGDETISDSSPVLNANSIIEYSATSGSRAVKNWDYSSSTLKINGSGGTFTLPAALDVVGINISAGTLDVTVSDRQINISGNWTNLDTFTQQEGTVVFDGTNQTITGSTTFYNFTKTESLSDSTDETLTFDNTATQTISGLITLDGRDANDMINLVSDSPGTQWSLTANGTFAIDYTDVIDSDASAGTTVIHTNNVNSGNNLNWFPLSNFLVEAPSTANSGTAFSVTITARDTDNNATTDVSGSTTLSVNQSGTISPSTVAVSEFTDDGIYTGNLTISSITEQPSVTLIATNGSNIGTDTITVSGVPLAPTIGSGLALTTSSIRWSFTDNSSYETGFRLYDNSDTLVTYFAVADLTSLDETSLSSGTQYSGRYIKAYNNIGESSVSDTMSATTKSSSGGGFSPVYYERPIPPLGGLKVLINNNNLSTNSRNITLNLIACSNTEKMAISNTPDFKVESGIIPYQSTYSWDLCYQQETCIKKEHTVYVKYFTQYGQSSETILDTIMLSRTDTNKKALIEQLKANIVEIQEKIIILIQQLIEMLMEEVQGVNSSEE